MSRAKRIAKELEDVKRDKLSGVTLELADDDNDDISHLLGSLQGPPGTPYENGVFQVDIKIPDAYPFKPPIMKFITPVYHPNISSQTGAICLDILKNAWTPILTLKSSLISLQSLLQCPEPTDPQDAQVAKVFMDDPKKFADTAALWTKIHAYNNNSSDNNTNNANKSSSPSNSNSYGFIKTSEPAVQDEAAKYGIEQSTVKIFEDMGFPRDKIILALRKLNLKKIRVDDINTQQSVLDEILR